MKWVRNLAVILSIIIGAATLGYGFHSYFAKQSDLEQVVGVQTIHILSIELSAVRRELWDLTGRYGPHCQRASRQIQERCLWLVQQEENIMRRMDQMHMQQWKK